MTKRITLILIFASTLITGFVSCVKKDPISRITQVLMVPLSPDALAVDFKINNTLFATTVSYSSTTGTVTYNLPYYTIAPGTTNVYYNLTGTPNAYASKEGETLEDKAYSTFFIDSIKRAKLAWVVDDLDDPTPGKVKIRFFHFSPNAPAVDVVAVSTGAKWFANRTFNDQEGKPELQSFIEVDPGSYTFAFRLAGTATAAYTTSTITLLPDRIYTLAARGVVGGAGSKALGAWVYPNKP